MQKDFFLLLAPKYFFWSAYIQHRAILSPAIPHIDYNTKRKAIFFVALEC